MKFASCWLLVSDALSLWDLTWDFVHCEILVNWEFLFNITSFITYCIDFKCTGFRTLYKILTFVGWHNLRLFPMVELALWVTSLLIWGLALWATHLVVKNFNRFLLVEISVILVKVVILWLEKHWWHFKAETCRR